MKDFLYRNRIELNLVAAILVIGATTLLMKVFETPTEKTLSAEELKMEIDKCYAAGGAPTPVYDAKDPIRVFALDCPKGK